MMRNHWHPLVVLIAHFVAGVIGQLEELVLGGNYGSSMRNIPDLRAIRGDVGNEGQFIAQGIGPEGGQGPRIGYGESYVPTLTEILQAYSNNYEQLLKRTESIAARLVDIPNHSYCTQSCNMADLNPKPDCYLECITSSENEHIQMLRTLVADTSSHFCKPLKTALDRLFVDGAGRSNFQSITTFREALEMNDKTSDRIRLLMSHGIMGIIIRYSNTTLSPLKHVISKIDDALNNQFSGKTYNVQDNPDCDEVQINDAYDVFIAALKMESSLTNVFLPGYALMNTMSKYISTKDSFRLTVLSEFYRLVTGHTSGFGCDPPEPESISSQEDEVDEDDEDEDSEGSGQQLCDELGKAPLLGFPIPPIPNINPGYMTIMAPLCIKEEPTNTKIDIVEDVAESSHDAKTKKNKEVKD